MSFKASVVPPDLSKQAALLNQFPQIAEKHFRPAMERVVRKVEGEISPNIPTLTGAARSDFGSKVTGQGLTVTGEVGFFGKNWYINVVEHGAKPHSMNTYVPRLGVYVREHRGFGGRYFMKSGFDSTQDMVENEFHAAAERVLDDMVVAGRMAGQ